MIAMPLTDSERKTLNEIEEEFRRPSPPPRPSQSGRGWSRRVVIAAIVLPVGTAALWLSLIIDNHAGVALAAIAYLAMVGSAAVLANSIARHRVARAGLGERRPVLWNRRYLR